MPLKLTISKEVVPDFQHVENIHCDREIFPLTEVMTFFYP